MLSTLEPSVVRPCILLPCTGRNQCHNSHSRLVLVLPTPLQGVQLLAGDSKDVGPWALHLRPAPSAADPTKPSKAAAGSRLHHLGMRLQDGQQLVQLKQLMLQALMQNAQRLGCVLLQACCGVWLSAAVWHVPRVGKAVGTVCCALLLPVCRGKALSTCFMHGYVSTTPLLVVLLLLLMQV